MLNVSSFNHKADFKKRPFFPIWNILIQSISKKLEIFKYHVSYNKQNDTKNNASKNQQNQNI